MMIYYGVINSISLRSVIAIENTSSIYIALEQSELDHHLKSSIGNFLDNHFSMIWVPVENVMGEINSDEKYSMILLNGII